MSNSTLRRRAVLKATGSAMVLSTTLPTAAIASSQADGPTVYVGSRDNTLYAVDAKTGDEVWAFTQPDGEVSSSPTVVDGTVYVGSADSTLYAIDAETGEEEWAFTKPGPIFSSPTVVDGTVYIGSTDSTLYAVDAKTGEEEWAFTEPDGEVSSSPTVVNGTVYIGATDSTLYAVDAKTGDRKWTFNQGQVILFSSSTVDWKQSSPNVVDDIVYIGATDSTLYAVDAETGEEEWAFTEPDGEVLSSPTVLDGTVYFEANDDLLYAVDAENGDGLWTAPGAGVNSIDPTTIEDIDGGLDGGRICASGGVSIVYAVDAGTGDPLWNFTEPDGEVFSSPTVFDDTLYVGADDGTLYAVDAGTGEEEWAFTVPGDSVRSSPTVVVDPSEGHSVDSRVRLRTLGHHDKTTEVAPAFFEVTLDNVDNEVIEGNDLTVTYTVENTGDLQDSQDIIFVVDGGQEATESGVSLDGGDTFSGSFIYTTEDGDAPEIEVSVASDDDSVDATVDVLTPKEAIERLVEKVEDFGLLKGVEDSLTAKLEAAADSLERGNEEAAVKQLCSFIEQVEALRGQKLTDEEADELIDTAQAIIDALDGEC